MEPDLPDLLQDLRSRFLLEGRECCNGLLETDGGALDVAAVRDAAHVWAGLGGMLGCAEISLQARLIETLIAEPYDETVRSGRDALVGIDVMFQQLLPYSRSSAIEVLS